MKKKGMVYLLLGVLLTGLLAGCSTMTVRQEEPDMSSPVSYEGMMKDWKQNAGSDGVTCWYTSDADEQWLLGEAKAFEKEYGIKVDLIYYDGVSFFDDMNRANQNGSGPDVYLMGNDQLELARNSGMLAENTGFDDAFWKENYPETAKKALTYHGRQYGYPVYFDTYCLVYDARLLKNAPASIDDILVFLDEYEDTGSTKAIFRWDVADAYINTMFIASYAKLFGEDGDEENVFLVNDDKSVAAMEYFQSLSAYLWMDKSNISHDTVMNRIKDGTLVLGLCKSDILPVLYEMNKERESAGKEESRREEKAEGETDTQEGQSEDAEQTNYQISYVPSLTSELSSTTLSTTYSAFVNPYAGDEAGGNMFALYLSFAHPERQYAGNGKLPVVAPQDGFDNMQTVIYAQYLNSMPVPKVMLLGDYLTESGIAFDAIWSGADVKEQLDRLQETIEQKINE